MAEAAQAAPSVAAVHAAVARVVTGMRVTGRQRHSSPHDAPGLVEVQGHPHGLLNFSRIMSRRHDDVEVVAECG